MVHLYLRCLADLPCCGYVHLVASWKIPPVSRSTLTETCTLSSLRKLWQPRDMFSRSFFREKHTMAFLSYVDAFSVQ